MNREQAHDILMKYMKGENYITHSYAVEAIMKGLAKRLAPDQVEYWGIVGLLHDLDFEQWPEEHCIKSQELMREAGLDEALIHATASHGWGEVCDIKPEHEMEKVLFACDELTGLIGAAALMRPSRSYADMELKSLKKKFKDKKFAAGCSREVISKGAELLGWDLDKLLDMTLRAMQATEADIESQMA